MPNLIADGAAGTNGTAGFDFNIPAGKGVDGAMANCNWWDDDCAQVGGPGGPVRKGARRPRAARCIWRHTRYRGGFFFNFH